MRHKIFFILILFLSLIAGIVFALSQREETVILDNLKNKAVEEINNNPIIEQGREKVGEIIEKKEEIGGSLPARISIPVPFTPQAPFGEWDAYHEDACEEASIVMVKYFLDKKTLTAEIADREILKMIDYEVKTFGRFEDSDAAEMVKIAAEFYGIKNLKVIRDFAKEDLKKYLARGKPIIIPAAGRMLGNPNYKQPGPLYHVLVLTGYDGNRIITNDPGTRKGESYKYNLDTLYNAIHDFPGEREDIENGRKAMLVLE